MNFEQIAYECLYQEIACAQKCGARVCVIDTTHKWRNDAAERHGVNLAALFLSRPLGAAFALETLQGVAGSGKVDVVFSGIRPDSVSIERSEQTSTAIVEIF